jgi:SAM-dependent methyltransferase
MEGIRRFDDRVSDYERYRPGYPDTVAGVLAGHGVRVPADVADIGAGTGKLAEVFVRAGHRVVLVEPNEAMRGIAQRLFAAPEGHASGVQAAAGGQPVAAPHAAVRAEVRAGTAEATGLPDASVDALTAGQAFHWFEPRATRREWRRILRPGGPVLLVWNDRRTAASPILADYEALLVEHCPDYAEVQRRTPTEADVRAFLGASAALESFDNEQLLDWQGLLGRAMSASYVPKSGPAHQSFVAGLRRAFERHAEGGRVRLPYDTRVFHGRLD